MPSKFHSLFALGACLAGFLASALWAQDQSYSMAARDLISVRVFEEPDLNVEVRISADGSVQLPLIGRMVVAGMTEEELRIELKRRLELDYLRSASVTVEIVELRSRPISVHGAVTKPGPLTISGRLTLLEALSEAGGMTAERGNRIQVSRVAQNGLADQLEISVDELLAGADPLTNIPLMPNDRVNVTTKSDMTIYFLGEVAVRGQHTFAGAGRVTLMQAIASIGGLSERASNKITIKRTRDDGTLDEIVVSFKRILSGKDQDVELRDQDLILVKPSFL